MLFPDDERGEQFIALHADIGSRPHSTLAPLLKNHLLEKLGNSTKLCAHNGKEFDFPYLCRRLLINNLALPNLLNLAGKKPWDVPHLDTLELWKFGDYKHYTSLDLLTAIFNIPSSKGDMDGSMVNSVYYKDKDLKKIAELKITSSQRP